jgi:methylenetetrahydrofolate reductase (NADPH)
VELDVLREKAASCQACDLWKNATQTVFGEGRARARVMLVGEQPGDREDIEGAPFVGPAGRVLDDGLRDAGIDRAFVVGGDADEPGEFLDGLALLRGMADLGRLPAEVGCPCYPQGHPDIPDEVLAQALRDKAPLVHYMTTQLCFDPTAIATFIADSRAEGIELPVKLGIPGVAEIPKLMSISARIGVKDASKFVLRNYRFVGQLLKSGGIYKPSRLLHDLAAVMADPAARVIGLHVYTFNNVPATVAWRDAQLADLDGRRG